MYGGKGLSRLDPIGHELLHVETFQAYAIRHDISESNWNRTQKSREEKKWVARKAGVQWPTMAVSAIEIEARDELRAENRRLYSMDKESLNGPAGQGASITEAAQPTAL